MKFFKWMVPAVIGTMAFGLTACGDDDDENNDVDYNDANSGSVISGDNGSKLLVTSVGNLNYAYNSRGFLTSFSGGSLNWNSMKLNYDENDEIYDFEVNAQGYIIDAECKESGSYDDYTYTDDYDYDFRYNNSGELVGFTIEIESRGTDMGEAYSESTTIQGNLTWTNGCLTKLHATGSGIDSGDRFTETFDVEYSYAANALENKYRQHTPGTSIALVEEPFIYMACSGIFGKGSAKLPTSVTSTDTYKEDGESPDVETETHNFAYTLNSDGTIATETWDGSLQWDYGYTTYSEAQKMRAAKGEVLKLIKGMKSMQRRHRK